MRPIDADALKRGIEVICKDERASISAVTYFALMAFINKTPTIEVEPDNRWISVKHMLPPYGERVLVVNEAYEAKRGYTRYNCGITIRDPHLNFTFWGHKVTHWQPLPEPPKIGE